jgi:hypothetical protein
MTSLRTLLFALGTALNYPRVLLTMWVIVTLPALLAVFSAAQAIDRALAHHPGARLTLDQSLDSDFARLHPEAAIDLGGGVVFVLLASAFLAGGILSLVGTGRRFTYGRFLAESGRLFLRNLRVLAIAVIVSAALFWGIGVLDHYVREVWLYEADAGATLGDLHSPWASLQLGLEAMRWIYGFVFVLLLLLTKMAMARLAVLDRRSALLAWLAAAGTMLRHPLRALALPILWLAVWMGVAYLIGEVTVYALEVRHEPWLALLSGQAGILWTQLALIALLLAARTFAVRTVIAPAAIEEPVLEADPS